MNKKVRIITLCVLAIMIVICVSLGITKAFMKPVEDTSSVTEVSLSSCAKITLTDKGSINLNNTYPMSKNRALNTTPYSFTVTSSCDSFVGFNLYIATFNTNTLDASKIHYIITEVGSKDIISEGLVGEASNVTSSFTDQEKTEYNVGMKGNVGTIYQVYNANIPYKGSTSYDLYLYVDENATNVTSGQTFNAGIAVKSYDTEPTLADYIKSLYTTQGASTLYHHDGTILATEANASLNIAVGDIIDANDGSYRYAGSYEATNNWVCFGTDDEDREYLSGWCDDEHLYRIIGVFDEKVIGTNGNPTGEIEKKVKLIKGHEGAQYSLGATPDGYLNINSSYYKGKLTKGPGYYWSGSSTNYSDEWDKSSLNIRILNNSYLEVLESYWRSKISITQWSIGSNIDTKIISKNIATAYQNEIVSPYANTTTNGKIGLMYASDYGFAASPENWITSLNSYNNDTNRNNNWLFFGMYEWTISSSCDGRSVYMISPDGGVTFDEFILYRSIRPTFYLNSDVTFAGGSGTEADPYRIA